MSNKKKLKPMSVPMSVPRIGGHQQQQPFDVSQAFHQSCVKCGGKVFDLAMRLGLVSRMATGNRTGQDVLVKFEVYLCRNCGHEYGQAVEVKTEGK